MSGFVLARLLREARIARRPKPPSDLQETADSRHAAEAEGRAHPMAPGWYPHHEHVGLRTYFDGEAFTQTERWDGSAWVPEN